ncbi:11843_t:CDS:2 [Funneliformis mosseae]|uniref:11843_t:CDS:1 n=1 Tax=Funneliformis mosseae TaxID=27381 RepID=A0A9N9CAC2_FUNMO|nr:11843_t:CDS:2 [Funneliformis mosseae]
MLIFHESGGDDTIMVYKFWMRSYDPELDKAMINILYQNGFLQTIPSNMLML